MKSRSTSHFVLRFVFAVSVLAATVTVASPTPVRAEGLFSIGGGAGMQVIESSPRMLLELSFGARIPGYENRRFIEVQVKTGLGKVGEAPAADAEDTRDLASYVDFTMGVYVPYFLGKGDRASRVRTDFRAVNVNLTREVELFKGLQTTVRLVGMETTIQSGPEFEAGVRAYFNAVVDLIGLQYLAGDPKNGAANQFIGSEILPASLESGLDFVASPNATVRLSVGMTGSAAVGSLGYNDVFSTTEDRRDFAVVLRGRAFAQLSAIFRAGDVRIEPYFQGGLKVMLPHSPSETYADLAKDSHLAPLPPVLFIQSGMRVNY